MIFDGAKIMTPFTPLSMALGFQKNIVEVFDRRENK